MKGYHSSYFPYSPNSLYSSNSTSYSSHSSNLIFSDNTYKSVSYNTDKEQEETIALYSIISGRIKKGYIDQLNKYNISDPNSEKILEYCKWEDYRNLDAYQNCIVKNSDYYRSVTTKYTLKDLKMQLKLLQMKKNIIII